MKKYIITFLLFFFIFLGFSDSAFASLSSFQGTITFDETSMVVSSSGSDFKGVVIYNSSETTEGTFAFDYFSPMASSQKTYSLSGFSEFVTGDYVSLYIVTSTGADCAYYDYTACYTDILSSSETWYSGIIFFGTPPSLEGCTDPEAYNYDPNATEDDESCVFGDPISVSPSPAWVGFGVDVTCTDVNNGFVVFDSDEVTVLTLESCADGETFANPFTVVGDYIIYEYDPLTYEGDPATDPYATAVTDVGYWSDVTLTVQELPTGTCTGTEVCYYDWLLVNIFILFFLTMMSLGLFINFYSKR